MQNNLKILKYVTLLFIIWRSALIFTTLLGLSTFANTNSLKGLYFPPKETLDYWTRWANWDGGHYLSIASHGYLPFQTVFFPTFPLLIKIVSYTGLNYFWSGFLISQIATLTTLFYLYKLALLDFNQKTAQRIIFAFIIFPTSFYLGSLYTESLFLAFTLSAFYYIRKRSWKTATVLIGLSSITRIIGLTLIPLLFMEYLLLPAGKFSLSDLSKTFSRRTVIILILFNIGILLLQHFSLSYKIFPLIEASLVLVPTSILLLMISTLAAVIEWTAPRFQPNKLLNPTFGVVSFSLLPSLLWLYFQKVRFGSYLNFISE